MMPFIDSQSCDPALHALCVQIARKCVWVVKACLREEERMLAVREFYKVAREALEKPKREEEL
jgi:hypothetical protein